MKALIRKYFSSNLKQYKNVLDSINSRNILKLEDLKETLKIITLYPSITPPKLMEKIENSVINKIMALDYRLFIILYRAFSINKENGTTKIWFAFDRKIINEVKTFTPHQLGNILMSFSFKSNKSHINKLYPYICKRITENNEDYNLNEIVSLLEGLVNLKYLFESQLASNYFSLENKENDSNFQSINNNLIDESIINLTTKLCALWNNIDKQSSIKDDNKDNIIEFDTLVNLLFKINELKIASNTFLISIPEYNSLTKNSVLKLFLLGYSNLNDQIIKYLVEFTPKEINLLILILNKNNQYSNNFKNTVNIKYLELIDEDVDLMNNTELLLYFQTILEINKVSESINKKIIKSLFNFDFQQIYDFIEIIHNYETKLETDLINIVNQGSFIDYIAEVVSKSLDESNYSVQSFNIFYYIVLNYFDMTIVSSSNKQKLKVFVIEVLDKYALLYPNNNLVKAKGDGIKYIINN